MHGGRRVLPAVLMTLLAACGGGGDEAGTTGEEQQEPAEVRSAAEQAVPETSRSTPGQEPTATRPSVVRESEDSPFGYYTIQMSSWRSRAKAESEAERYRGMGLEAYVQQADLGEKGTWYRVRVGRYPALSEAQEAARSLTGVDPDRAWVDNYRERRTPPPLR